MTKYNVEWTDTFAGEANYCWVDRYIVEAPSIQRAMTIAKQHRYVAPVPRDRRQNYGDMLRADMIGACVVCFVDWHDCGKPDCDCEVKV